MKLGSPGGNGKTSMLPTQHSTILTAMHLTYKSYKLHAFNYFTNNVDTLTLLKADKDINYSKHHVSD